MQLNRNIKKISDLQSLKRKQLHVNTLSVRRVHVSVFIYNIFYYSKGIRNVHTVKFIKDCKVKTMAIMVSEF